MNNMKNYKVIFPTGYKNTNIVNDNIDINIVFETGEVYCASLATLENIQSFFSIGDIYYWMSDMIIMKDLKKDTIRLMIDQVIIEREYLFDSIFDKIGNIDTIFGGLSYDQLVDMNDLSTDNSPYK